MIGVEKSHPHALPVAGQFQVTAPGRLAIAQGAHAPDAAAEEPAAATTATDALAGDLFSSAEASPAPGDTEAGTTPELRHGSV